MEYALGTRYLFLCFHMGVSTRYAIRGTLRDDFQSLSGNSN